MKPLEEWRDIEELDGLYQVSNLGRVQSLDRVVNSKDGREIPYEGKILKPSINSTGYLTVNLYNNKQYTRTVHQLVAIAFLGHDLKNGLVVDHVDNNPHNNKVDNLQLITQRKNGIKDTERGFSKYVGVTFVKGRKERKWRSIIYFNKRKKNLGYFKTELEAHIAYQNKLNEIS